MCWMCVFLGTMSFILLPFVELSTQDYQLTESKSTKHHTCVISQRG